MTMPWMNKMSQQDSPAGRPMRGDGSRQESSATDDISLIPWWSAALAVVAFAAMEYLFYGVMPHAKREMLPLRALMAYSWGTLVASYVLLVGYVSRDVKRRNMPGALWMLIVIMMPGGIGAVVYFLLRQPILSRCPHCSTEIAASYHFCPQCQFQMAPVCGRCFRGVEITDVYCKQCGHDLEQDHLPARLRAYSD
jgi:hypothetical protein